MKESLHEPDTMKKTLTRECCMCGDFGFSNQLFLCKICHFRSQHRYCSNQYPSISRVCNWCLSDKSHNSSNSSSSSSLPNHQYHLLSLKKPTPILQRHANANAGGPVKKERSTAAGARKRLVKEAERLRRTRSEDIAKVGITRRFFRNRVRRYKLLQEVST